MADTIKEPKKEETPPGGKDPLLDTDPKEGEGDQSYEYQHPLLKGKTPEQIEELFGTTDRVVAGQKGQLDKARADLAAERAAPRPPAKPEEPVKDFFTDPEGAMKRLEDRLVAQIAPLREDIKTARSDLRAQGSEERLAARHPDWAETRPYIDTLLAEREFPDPNDENLLETLYYTARGIMLEQGVIAARGTKEEPVTDDPHKGPVPQHRVSPPPAPPRTPKKDETEVSWDDLDETERHLCKYYKMTPKDFKDWQAADISDVAESDIGVAEEKGA